VQSASPPLWQVFTVKWAVRLELLKKRTHARHSVSSQLVKYNIIVATSLWLSARKYTKKNSVKMVFVLYSSNGNASETKANESFDNGVFFDIEAKRTPSKVSKLFLKRSEHIR
jgi:hypothetical protein